jgi:glycosyltransferase involved in cell wall biosynthesis
LHFGYIGSKHEYAKWLKQGDIVVSTADHEFFGMAVIEAVRAGCRPLLPDWLSYPELFPKEFLYTDDNFKNHLREALTSKRLDRESSEKLTQPYSWDSIAEQYGSWITDSQ